MNKFENVGSKEIENFDPESETWWYSDGEMKMLRTLNPLRTRFILERVTDPHPRILDVGCGGGILSMSLTRAGAQVIGVDLSEAPIQTARRWAQAQGLKIEYRHESLEEFVEKQTAAFDAVVGMELLEHVPDPHKVVAACAKLLKPGGQAFFSTANRIPKALLFAIIGGEFILRLLPRGTHSYSKFVRPEELKSWGRSAGLEFVSIASLIYNPFTCTFKVAVDKEDINYMMHFTKK